MSIFEELTRKPVRKFSPYIPGRPIEEIKERFGLKEVIKLASNENPLGPSPLAVEALKANLADINRYPEGGSTRLRQAIAKRYGVDPKCVLAGSGSDEIIEIFAKAFLDREDSIVCSEHAFIRYKMAGQLMDCTVIEAPMAGFRHNLKAMLAAIRPNTKIVFIANPNNPTGTYVTREELTAFVAEAPAEKLVVVDEAYYEYAREIADYPDSLDFLRSGHRNVAVLRTFSKAYGLAGLRTGYAIADPSVIEQLDRIRPPFNLTIPSQAACEAALGDTKHVAESVRVHRECYRWICGKMKEAGVEYVESAANFVLVRTKVGSVRMFNELLTRGVIVRPMAEYGFPEHVRVSVGSRREMETFWRHFCELEGAA